MCEMVIKIGGDALKRKMLRLIDLLWQTKIQKQAKFGYSAAIYIIQYFPIISAFI